MLNQNSTSLSLNGWLVERKEKGVTTVCVLSSWRTKRYLCFTWKFWFIGRNVVGGKIDAPKAEAKDRWVLQYCNRSADLASKNTVCSSYVRGQTVVCFCTYINKKSYKAYTVSIVPPKYQVLNVYTRIYSIYITTVSSTLRTSVASRYPCTD